MLSDKDFQQELINRFFHPKSYFFRCVNHELDCLLKEQGTSAGESHLLFANLLDKLLTTENKMELLQSLAQLNGFRQIYEKLNQGTKQLRDAGLDYENMKIKIEALAQTLVRSGVQALGNSQTGNQLKKLIGFQDHNHQEPPSEVADRVEPEVVRESPYAFPETADEENDFLLILDEGKDALLEGGCEYGLSEEGGSDDFSLAQQPQSINLDGEPANLIKFFREEMATQLEQFRSAVAALKQEPQNRALWLNCDNIFEHIAAGAMIYGLESSEELAEKSRKFVAKVLAALPRYAQPGLTILCEIRDVFSSLLNSDLENLNEQSTKALISKLLTVEETLRQIKSNNNDVDRPKKIMPAELQPHNPNPDSAVANFNLANLKLPGEDDIVKLIKEITEGEAFRRSAGHEAIQATNFDSPEAINRANSSQENQQPAIRNVTLPKGQLNLFKQQSEFYFNVIEDTLEKLKTQPEDQKTLEDLEMASNSLYRLTLKMSLEPLSPFPASVKDLVRKLLFTKSPLSENERQLIENVYQGFHELESLEDIGKREIEDLLHLLQERNSARHVRHSENESDGGRPDRSRKSGTRSMS